MDNSQNSSEVVAETVHNATEGEELQAEPDSQETLPLENEDRPTHDERGKFAVGHVKFGGRQAGSVSLTTLVRQKLMRLMPNEKRTYFEALAESIVAKALEGEDIMMKGKVWAYLDGMPATTALNLNSEVLIEALPADKRAELSALLGDKAGKAIEPPQPTP